MNLVNKYVECFVLEFSILVTRTTGRVSRSKQDWQKVAYLWVTLVYRMLGSKLCHVYPWPFPVLLSVSAFFLVFVNICWQLFSPYPVPQCHYSPDVLFVVATKMMKMAECITIAEKVTICLFVKKACIYIYHLASKLLLSSLFRGSFVTCICFLYFLYCFLNSSSTLSNN